MKHSPICIFRQRALILVFLLGLRIPVSLAAGEAKAGEGRMKAAFIFNFMQFIEWPENSFRESGGTLVLGIYGDCRFEDCLEQLQNRDVKGHPIQVIRVDRFSDISKCHMLFVPTMKKEAVKALLSRLPFPAPVTVGEQDGFAEMGGAINLFVGEGQRLAFEVNVQAASGSGVKISSRLLRLAVLIPSGERSRSFSLSDERYVSLNSFIADDPS
jgi:hypothetical protein